MRNILQFLRAPLLVASLLAVVFATPLSASAVNVFQNCSSGTFKQTSYCQQAASQTGNPLIHFITIVINVVSFVAGAAAIVVLIISGLRFMLSNGDSNAVASARNGIIYALVGIGVIVIAQGIVVFVLNNIK